MKIIETPIDGLSIIETNYFSDDRGGFMKIFNYDFFRENGLEWDFKEIYFSANKKNVIRGMHFQTPPFDHTKLVYCSKGSLLDVVIDLRASSSTYGQSFSLELNDNDGRYLYIPSGFAHGFKSLKDDTICNYAQTSCYAKDNDCGISLDSFGFDWQVDELICSERDKTFPRLDEFITPFK